MQFANPMINMEQLNINSNSIEDRCFSSLSHNLLSGIPMQYHIETASTVTLNCSSLKSINSHGICLLMKLLIYAKSQRKRLQVFGLSEHNQYIFEITRLSKFIDIIDTKDQFIEKVHLDSTESVFSQEDVNNGFHSYSNE